MHHVCLALRSDGAEMEAEAAQVSLVEEIEAVDVTLVLAFHPRGASAAYVHAPVIGHAPSLSSLASHHTLVHKCH